MYYLLGGTLFVLPLFGFAYDEKTTHPALTQEIVKFFNLKSKDLKISDEDTEYIIQGSIDEDAGARWMYHFYDPVYNRGLSLVRQWRSSKDWGQNTLAQAKYDVGFEAKSLGGTLGPLFGSKTDYSWERGIYEYAWGNKKWGLLSLGHILHLIEDATVPDHSRNDPHPPILDWGSPYENWTKKFDRQTINPGEIADEKLIILNSLDDYFNKSASYSNNYFFSKDTIFSKEYISPTVIEKGIEKLSDGRNYSFGYGEDSKGNKFRLIQIKESPWQDPEYSLKDPDLKILSDYWSLLSKQAVLNGAGVVKLFFDEVEKEKQTRALYNKNRSWLGKQIDKFKRDSFKTANVLYGITPKLEDLEEKVTTEVSPPKGGETSTTIIETPSVLEPPKVKPAEVSPPTVTAVETSKQTPPPAETKQPPLSPTQPKPSANTSSFLPIAGAGGGRKDDEPPSPPHIITEPSQDNLIFATTTITFRGRAERKTTVINSFSANTVKVADDENWSLTLGPLPQGTTTIDFSAKDEAGNKSQSKSRTVFIDTTGPQISLTINECGQSLSSSSCLTPKTTLNLEWSSTDPELSHFLLECEANGSACQNFNISQTNATTTTYSVPGDNTIYTFKARAVDIRGNVSPTETKTVEIISRPLIINEIAWMGTSATRSSDEWLEIHNTTDKTINLANWVLRSETDQTPYIQLSGSIGAKSFLILERTDDNTISDITAHQTYTGALENSGEVVELLYASTTIDKTPEISTCGGWCAGVAGGQYLTMERYEPLSSGTDASNWNSWGGFLANGKNADNAAINGTPGKRNSINYLITKDGSTLAQNKTLKKSGGPYLVTTDYIVNSGITLTIDPGVVVKFYNGASALIINGTLKAEGTSTDKIVFTSFKDDSYGGDMNQDAAATTPQYGDWGTIKIAGSGSFDQTLVRYGGVKDSSSNFWANIRSSAGSVVIKNSTIEEAGVYGLWFNNASASIQSSTIKNNTHDNQASGIVVGGGSLTEIKNSVVENNLSAGILLTNSTTTTISDSLVQNHQSSASSRGLSLVSSSPSIKNTTFKNNTVAIEADGSSSVSNGGGIIFEGNTTNTVPANLIP
ncbi:MAG: right-handed parallel beta-helix repeat-containing protein [Candidatus Sungiibacteriota bacterium]|uniref:Right-handed parallel beta-helix repeat-containing protein n=1 Tax=Candidatus Sungiibacteriota bacterium TaxID=2750080 RepID=A0A7T5RJY1_9BACT|nr:MAG: right-handed parallel beta-helix repeat-containing protein [Candidatus Sungbacteria bacterium]